MQSTALKQVHESLGARLVPFAGWTMPVQYTGILEEVRHVRTRAGLFDLGHMGRVAVSGRDAEPFLQRLQTNDVTKIPPGGIRYSLILDEDGKTQDDILVYRDASGGGFFLVINAGNTPRDLEIMRQLAAQFDREQLRVDDRTQELGMLAIQGPASLAITQRLTRIDLSALRYYTWTHGEVAGVACSLSRTGYTGEDGFEVYVPQGSTVDMWQAFLEAGRMDGLQPIGLAARDTLRLEAGMPLYGHEIDETTNPLEANLGFAVKFTHDFTGRTALEKVQAAGGTGRKLVGLTTTSQRVPRQGYPVFAGERPVGSVCSGSVSPTLGTNIATAYVEEAVSAPGTELAFGVRDRREPAQVTALPFYKRAR